MMASPCAYNANDIILLTACIGAQELDIKRFRAKVALDNKASFNLFENKLGFKEVCACMRGIILYL